MISIVIPVYKNKKELVENLKKNLPFFKECEVIVVNDYPASSIKDDLKDFDLTLVENERNLGFAGAVNVGVEKAKGKFVVLLNSDVILHDESFKTASKWFDKNSNLFAVSFLQKEKDGKMVGKNKIFMDLGLLKHKMADDMDEGFTAWAEGGSSMFDREKFLKLGGLDTLYSPFYWEDIDLSYRAWKAGYEIFFDPQISVTHYHESTIGKYFDEKKIKKIAFRNQHVFMMKNITDRKLILAYWVLLPLNLLYFLIKKEVLFITGFFEAFKKISKIAEHRKKQIKSFVLQDSKVLSRFI